MNYQAQVKFFKETARDGLRMELISNRMSIISGLEKNIKTSNTDIENTQKEIARCQFLIDSVDPRNPDKDVIVKNNKGRIESYNSLIETYKKDITQFEKQITEQKEGIAKIEKGETLVSKDALAALVDTMITVWVKEQAKKTV